MNREPKVRWMEDKIVLARRYWFGRKFGHGFFPGLLRFLGPRIIFYVFIPDRFWPGEAAASLKISRAAIDRCHVEKRRGADDVLVDTRIVRRSIKLLLVLQGQSRADEARAFGLHRGF